MMKQLLKSALLGAVIMLSAVPPALAQSGHLITMQEADIRAFIDDVSMVTGRTFLIDPRVQGKVSIASDERLSKSEVFEVFKDVMRVHGYTLIRTSTGEYRITLMQGAAQDAPLVQNSGLNGQFATIILRLDNSDAAEAAKLIKPVMHSQGVLTANPGGRVIVVTDYPENLKKAREIVRAMDVNDSVIETISFQNITALDAQDAIAQLAGPGGAYRAIAMPGSNSLILEGSAKDVARLRPILAQMDAGGSVARGAISVIPLRFADGSSLIEVIDSLLPAYLREGQAPPTVAYEAGSNALIISASGETQQALETVIRRLDVRRPQVLVEAIIVEISDTAAKDLGVQFALGGTGSTVPLLSSNFSRQAPDMLALTGALAGDGLDVSDSLRGGLETAAVNSLLGLDGGLAGIGGRSGDTLFSAIITAVESDAESNVLSTPFITTLDNVPATFLVGQKIPITTGESLIGDTSNTFRTFDREEVGISLEVLPQISEGDVIRLEIKQEVSSISGALSQVTSDFVTNVRSIGTTVLASDGEIIVLGGLIQDDEEVNASKVPLLGDLPGVGPLFQSKSRSRARTNLMVFLRPTIIRQGRDAQPLTERRLQQIRDADSAQSGRERAKIDSFLDAISAPE